MLVAGLKEREARYQHVLVLGDGLLDMCTPAAAAPLADRLADLQEGWEALKQMCVQEQHDIKGTVDSMVEMRGRVSHLSYLPNFNLGERGVGQF